MTTTLGVADPVEILLKLVQDGEMDAWEIDIIEVTDRFLAELDKIGRDDPLLLARSARCLFYAAALVHLKAQALNDPSVLFDQQAEVEDEFFDDDFGLELDRLECPLFYPREDARLVPRERRPRGRALTLGDLLDALRQMDVGALMAEPEYEDYDDPWDVPFDEDIADIPTAHEDDLEGDILNLREELRERFADGETEVDLDELRGDMTRGEAFRALLFLAHDEEIDFDQEECYAELAIVKGPSPLREITDEEREKREVIEARRAEAQEKREQQRGGTRREIPRPGGARRGRKLNRRPGLAPPASSRRPRARMRGLRPGVRSGERHDAGDIVEGDGL